MRILAFVLERDGVHVILKHMRPVGLDPTALPEYDDGAWLLVGLRPPPSIGRTSTSR